MRYIKEPHPISAAWAANGAISLDLSNKPYTITAFLLVVRTNISTSGTPGTYNDWLDRIITHLTLSGGGHQFFDLIDLRPFYHHSRFHLGPYAPKRPSGIGASQTNVLTQFAYLIHFGIEPEREDPAAHSARVRYNPFDLTAGIPPSGNGNLLLNGTWGAAAAPGSGYTVNSAQLDVYAYGILPEPTDRPDQWIPRAFPAWLMDNPTLALSGAFGTSLSIPVGSFLHSITTMTTQGTNNPRSNTILNSIRVRDVLQSYTPITYGGQGGVNADYIAAELFSQSEAGLPGSAPIADDPANPGVLTVGTQADQGLLYLPLSWFAPRSRTPYGLDLRRVGAGSVALQLGVSQATSAALFNFYKRYDLNGMHPDNAGL